MRINRSYIIAGVAILLIIGWFALNSFGGDDGTDETAQPFARQDVLPTVVVRTVATQTRPNIATVYGRTRPNRSVDVKARTAASVTAVPVEEGRYVQKGTLICQQDVDARQAVVDQAKAAVAKAELDLQATERLVARGFKSPNAVAGDRATLDAARAQLRQAQTERGNVVMRAPFAGIFDAKLAEIGDYLAPGQPCGRVVELDPLKVEAELTETQIGGLEVGQTADVALATGQRLEGTVTFIESIANPATRTFRVEATVPNLDLDLKAGVSATVAVKLGEVEAASVPSAVLALDDEGRTGVRYVDATDTVRFAPVTVAGETPDGALVVGLPSPARVIVTGQDYVAEGAKVDVRRENTSGVARIAGAAD